MAAEPKPHGACADTNVTRAGAHGAAATLSPESVAARGGRCGGYIAVAGVILLGRIAGGQPANAKQRGAATGAIGGLCRAGDSGIR